MTSERGKLIEGLYRAALELAPEKRITFLASACGDDEDLRRTIEARLADSSPNQPGPPADATATMQAGDFDFGAYRMEAPLGAGGMGTVYRAVDTRLGRKVAIKIATARYSERFQREARAISALNHPHICTLYDVGPNYLVMELLDGPTLSDEIKKGPLSAELVTRYGEQAAGALAEAHAHGIVHRDLKPGNIMITRHGIKVLDFGIAKVLSEADLTETNAIVGTPAYMAPEQAEGREADERTDLFALGLVLYEMAAGRLPVPGASLGRMLASGAAPAIPPPCRAGSPFASRLNRLIPRLLEKDPERRPQSAAAVRQELLAEQQPQPVKPVRIALLAGILVLAVAALWWSLGRAPRAARWPEVSRVSPITTYPGDETTPAVSPDGVWLAFSWNGAPDGHRNIYVTRLDGLGEPRRLTLDSSPGAEDSYPAWSPDGRQIAFIRSHATDQTEILAIPAGGGPERQLREIRVALARGGLAWTPDGAQIAFAAQSLESSRSTLYLIRLANGKVRSLTTPPEGVIGDTSPAFSPDGERLAFVRWSAPETSKLLVQKLAGGEASGQPAVVPASGTLPRSPVWASNRSLLFLQEQQILEWEPGAGVQRIYLSGARLTNLSYAGRGTGGHPQVVVAQGNTIPASIWTLPLRAPGQAGGPPELESSFGNDSRNPDYSPDGKHVVFVKARGGNPELFTADADGGHVKQLTRMGARSLGVPRWSPDNRHVAFFARMPDEPQIYVIDAIQDQALPYAVTHEVPGCNIPTWSSDGRFVYCSRRIDGEMRLYRVPAEAAAGEPVEMERWFAGKEARETADGRVLYITDERPGLFARSLGGDPKANPEERLVEDIEGPIAYFAPVPEGIYYTGRNSSGAALRFFEYARRKSVDIAPATLTGPVNSLTVTPDGRRLVYTRAAKAELDLSLIEFQ